MGIYIQVENILTSETKRFGPYEAVSPDLMVDEGDGWVYGPVERIKDSVKDDDGEPFSFAEVSEGYGPYWHNCYIVEGVSARDDRIERELREEQSVFNHHMDYTSNPTMLRVSREHNGDWTLDGINELGQYTEVTWSYQDLETLTVDIPKFIEQVATGLKDEVTYQTKYLPIVTVTHDERGDVTAVEIDWSDSQSAVEQLQEDGTVIEEDTSENLGLFLDKWVEQQPQATRRGHWRWEVDNG